MEKFLWEKVLFINTLHGVMIEQKKDWKPIATVSLQRETFIATRYIYNSSFTANYEKDKELNKIYKEKIPEMKTREISISTNEYIQYITDYPGIDDSNDPRKCFEYFLDNMQGIVMFVIDASRAFIDASEKQYFEKVCVKAVELNEKGILCEVVIVVTKFDDSKECKALF